MKPVHGVEHIAAPAIAQKSFSPVGYGIGLRSMAQSVYDSQKKDLVSMLDNDRIPANPFTQKGTGERCNVYITDIEFTFGMHIPIIFIPFNQILGSILDFGLRICCIALRDHFLLD